MFVGVPPCGYSPPMDTFSSWVVIFWAMVLAVASGSDRLVSMNGTRSGSHRPVFSLPMGSPSDGLSPWMLFSLRLVTWALR